MQNYYAKFANGGIPDWTRADVSHVKSLGAVLVGAFAPAF